MLYPITYTWLSGIVASGCECLRSSVVFPRIDVLRGVSEEFPGMTLKEESLISEEEK